MATPAAQAQRVNYIVALVERVLGPVEVIGVIPRPRRRPKKSSSAC